MAENSGGAPKGNRTSVSALRGHEQLYMAAAWRTVPKLIEVIGPDLHHFDTLAPELRGMHVGATHVVFLHVGQLS